MSLERLKTNKKNDNILILFDAFTTNCEQDDDFVHSLHTFSSFFHGKIDICWSSRNKNDNNQYYEWKEREKKLSVLHNFCCVCMHLCAVCEEERYAIKVEIIRSVI